MVSLNRAELEEEIHAVKGVMNIHETGVKLNAQALKVNTFLLGLLEKELEKLPAEKAKV